MTDPNTVSTGVPELDAALGGPFWADNVVWELDDDPGPSPPPPMARPGSA